MFSVQRLPDSTFRLIEIAKDTAIITNTRLYLVGGIVRDVLRGAFESVFDVDLVVEGNAEPFASALCKRLDGILYGPTPFLTYRIDYRMNGAECSLDVVTARREIYPQPAYLPVVEPSCIDDDLARRDFTVNAMAVRLDTSPIDKVMDPFHGQDDLKNARLHILHSASFIDDPTRIFRAARFVARCHLTLDRNDELLLKNALPYIARLSGIRLRHEFEHIAHEKCSSEIFKLLEAWGVLSACGFSYASHDFYLNLIHSYRRYFKYFRCDDKAMLFNLFMISLCTGLLPRQIDERMTFLGIKSQEAKRIALCANIVSLRESLSDSLNSSYPESYADAYLCSLPEEAIFALAASEKSENTALFWLIDRHIRLWRFMRPIITGAEIKSLGLIADTSIGKALRILREQRINGNIRTRDESIALIRTL